MKLAKNDVSIKIKQKVYEGLLNWVSQCLQWVGMNKTPDPLMLTDKEPWSTYYNIQVHVSDHQH